MAPAGDVGYLTLKEWRSLPFVFHGFGTRALSEAGLEDIRQLRNFSPVQLRQIHSDIIHPLDGVPQSRLTGDALLTDRPGILLLIKTADCLPVLILSETPRAVAAVHCGWRGIRLSLLAKTIRLMCMIYGCPPSSLRTALGPSIAQDCYEVGEDVHQSFDPEGPLHKAFKSHPQKERKYFLDLKEASRQQLLECGVRREKILAVPCCSHCDQSFYSYRRNAQDKGRMLNFIGLLASP